MVKLYDSAHAYQKHKKYCTLEKCKMKISDEAFKELFHQQLLPRMNKIESLRHQTKIGCFYLLPTSVVITIIVGVATANADVIMTTLMVTGGASFAYALYQLSTYDKKFKTSVVSNLIELVDSTWQPYFDLDASAQSDKECLQKLKSIKEHFFKSHLRPEPYSNILVDDHIRGIIENTPFECTEVNLQQGSGKNAQTVFTGMFLQIDFDKHCVGETFINSKKDKDEQAEFVIIDKPATGFFGKDETRTLKPLYIDHTRFDRNFWACSGNPDEPNEILTPALLDTLSDIAEVFQKEMYFSFVGNHAYSIIKTNGYLFEAALMKTSLTIENAQEMYDLLTLAKEITKAIKTHTKIWSEE